MPRPKPGRRLGTACENRSAVLGFGGARVGDLVARTVRLARTGAGSALATLPE